MKAKEALYMGKQLPQRASGDVKILLSACNFYLPVLVL